MSETALYVGIDGGGTGCRGVLVDASGRELARAKGGAANVATDMAGSTRNVVDLVAELAACAQLSEEQVTDISCVLGLAGANVVKTNDPVVAALPCRNVYVTDDREVVIEGALSGLDGGVAAPGTGSFYACRVDGDLRSLGGWGFMLGDEGSGAWLGRKLLTLTMHCHDGVETHSGFTREILEKFNGQPSKMTQFANEVGPKEFAGFAPQIVAAAKAGDSHARRLMQDGADWIMVALRAMGFREGLRLCLWGGLGPEYLPYLDDGFASGNAAPLSDAAGGAAALAKKRFG